MQCVRNTESCPQYAAILVTCRNWLNVHIFVGMYAVEF